MFIIHIILAIILILSIYNQRLYLGPNNLAVNKSRGSKEESISKLLDRIEWSSNIKTRINMATRLYWMSYFASFLIIGCITNKTPDGLLILYSIVILWVTLFASITYFDFHSENFAPSYTKKNISFIRKKLKIKRGNTLDILDNIPKRGDPHFYESM